MIAILRLYHQAVETVDFIDLGDADPERVVPLLLRLPAYDDDDGEAGAALLGLVSPQAIDWRQESPVKPISTFWEVYQHDESCTAYRMRDAETKKAPPGLQRTAIWRLPWTPAQPCSCAAGELYCIYHPAEGHHG